jgi:Tol biopolymer transport system component
MLARPGHMARVLGPLLLVAATVATQGPASATFPGANGKVVFVGTGKGNEGDILKVPPQGGEPRHITDDLLSDADPAVSPNGKRVAYAKHSGGMGGDWEIFIVRMNGDGERQVTQGPNSGEVPAWTPNGKSLVYVRQRSGGGLELFKVRIGPEPRRGRRLTDTAGYEYVPDVSSDGLIVFTYTLSKGASELVLMRLDGTHRRRLTNTDNKIEDLPSWAPGAKKVAFTVRAPLSKDTTDIASIRVDGTHRERIIDHDNLNLFYPSWSPNGEWIAATASNSSFDTKIVRFRSNDGSPLRNITTFDQGGINPAWQPK